MLPVFIFIVGLAVASLTAAQQTTTDASGSVSATTSNNIDSGITFQDIAGNISTVYPTNITSNYTTISSTAATMNVSTTTSISITQSVESSTYGKVSPTPPAVVPTKPSKTPKTTASKTTLNPPPTSTAQTGNDSTGIIIIVVIIIVALLFGLACYMSRRRGRRYSVEFSSRPDDANIPLSTVEPELPLDAAPQNGLQTFESKEPAEKEPEEPEAKPEVQEEQKAEADKSAAEPSAETAAPAPAPSPDSSEDKPKGDAVEQSPPAPVEPSAGEKTDDEGVVSNKTSVESLKEANENNSNNADFSWIRELKSSNIFWEVPLDCPV